MQEALPLSQAKKQVRTTAPLVALRLRLRALVVFGMNSQ
jgi:hypothetical protein